MNSTSANKRKTNKIEIIMTSEKLILIKEEGKEKKLNICGQLPIRETITKTESQT